MPRTAFPGYDDPVKIEGDPEEVLRTLLEPEIGEPDYEEEVEPKLDN